jgi:hypothetical protein
MCQVSIASSSSPAFSRGIRPIGAVHENLPMPSPRQRPTAQSRGGCASPRETCRTRPSRDSCSPQKQRISPKRHPFKNFLTIVVRGRESPPTRPSTGESHRSGQRNDTTRAHSHTTHSNHQGTSSIKWPRARARPYVPWPVPSPSHAGRNPRTVPCLIHADGFPWERHGATTCHIPRDPPFPRGHKHRASNCPKGRNPITTGPSASQPPRRHRQPGQPRSGTPPPHPAICRQS